MKINIIESTMVKPSKPTPSEILFNSNTDLVVKSHVLTVYFFKPNTITTNFFDIKIMKEGLSNVLVSFYPMAGRLIWGNYKDNNGGEKRMEINCNEEGVLFVEAKCDDTTIDDFGDFVPSLEMEKLIPNSCGDIFILPLVMTQVTRFKCGGVCLGLGISHTLVDGVSGMHFIKSWSEMTRGFSVITVPPVFDRSFLRARDPPRPTFDHVEYHPPPTLKNIQGQVDQVNVPNSSTTAMFKITSDQLTLLKTKSEYNGSTYEVIAAHIWRCMCKARTLDDDQLTKLKVATNGRTRLCPPPPQGYIGNVVFTATPIAKSGELLSEPLAITARRIHDAVIRMNDEYLRSAIDYLELNKDSYKSIQWPIFDPNPNVKINTWSKLPVYDCDFGWGKSIHMGPASLLNEGLVYILPSSNNDKSLTLAMCLNSHHMPLLEKYLYDF
ncbi:shikimate O-hydroxycinnamoyltransferase [Capsicum annuum]